MSFQAMTWAIRQRLPSLQKLVLLLLADHANGHTGRCDPSIGRLADECGMSESSLRRSLAALEDAGLIRVARRSAEGVNLPNQYFLQLDADGCQPEGGGVTVTGGVVSDRQGGGVTVTGGGGVTLTPKPGTIQPGIKPGSLGGDLLGDQVNDPFAPTTQGRAIPEGFPDQQALQWASLEFNVPLSAVQEIAVEFRDYWKAVPGAAGRKLDWRATWRNNVRRKLPSKAVGGASSYERQQAARAAEFAGSFAKGVARDV